MFASYWWSILETYYKEEKFKLFIISSCFFLFILYFDFYFNLPNTPTNGYTRYLTSENIINTRIVIDKIEKDKTDSEWIPILRDGNIISIKPIKGEVFGLAEKWLVKFDTGHEAMVKPIERWSFLDRYWPIMKYNPLIESNGWRIRQADRTIQGANEIIAFYIDRILKFNRKPPIVGRYISSKVLYSYAFEEDKTIIRTTYDTFSKFRYILFEHAIPVSMHGWMDGLQRNAPSFVIQDYLTLENKHSRQTLGNWQKTYAADVSDTIIFDFILDDHDRGREHNWVEDSNHQLLLWDSGLAFTHGPRGRESCLKLLCGPDKWIERTKDLGESKSCLKICRFRESTIQTLQDLSKTYSKTNETLGSKLKYELEKDYLNPIFNYNIFYLYGRRPKVRFEIDDFFNGLDYKVDKLLNHVDNCIKTFGRASVFINY